jgi:hypothetical protein
MEAVDGFEPKEEASDPLWGIYYGQADATTTAVEKTRRPETKVTPLFKE